MAEKTINLIERYKEFFSEDIDLFTLTDKILAHEVHLKAILETLRATIGDMKTREMVKETLKSILIYTAFINDSDTGEMFFFIHEEDEMRSYYMDDVGMICYSVMAEHPPRSTCGVSFDMCTFSVVNEMPLVGFTIPMVSDEDESEPMDP